MSHSTYLYPHPVEHDCTCNTAWHVREDGDDYTTDSDGDNTPADTLLALTDHITERLTSAEALVLLLKSAEQPPEHALKVTAMLILDLIQEAREANEKVWEQARRLTRKDN